MLKTSVLLAFTAFAVFAVTDGWGRAVFGQSASQEERSPVVRLGERLFRDERFSTPNGDLPASCSHCHQFDEDPAGLRAYNDSLNRSWLSSRSQDRRRFGAAELADDL